jgi:hypothetical protein
MVAISLTGWAAPDTAAQFSTAAALTGATEPPGIGLAEGNACWSGTCPELQGVHTAGFCKRLAHDS